MKWLIGVIVVVLIIGGGYLILGNKNSMAPATSTTVTTAPSAAPSEAQMEAQNVTVVGTDFSFTPAQITATVGKPLAITFTNNGKFPHNLTIDKLGATKTVPAGKSDTITVTPQSAGTYSFKCTVDSHAEKGMTGTITVK